MAQENIELTLPVTDLKAVIKSYIPHKVSRKVQELFIGRKSVQELVPQAQADKTQNEEVLAQVELTGSDMLEFQDLLVKGLTIQLGDFYAVDGKISEAVDDLPQTDFNLLAEKVTELWKDFEKKTDPKEL